MSLDEMLHSLNRRSLLLAEKEGEQAEGKRDEIAGLSTRFPGSDPGYLRDRARDLGREIEGHERAARVHRRRAAHAGEGYLLLSRDEHTDVDFMGSNQNLVARAHAEGRVRHAEPLD
jgi:hypothetical protein